MARKHKKSDPQEPLARVYRAIGETAESYPPHRLIEDFERINGPLPSRRRRRRIRAARIGVLIAITVAIAIVALALAGH
jgi:hypothetical protein